MQILADTNLLFWVVSITAVLFMGLSKGGFVGLGLLAVPLMALVMSPTKAAAIMLPILIVMDMFSLHAYRKFWHAGMLRLMLPAAVVGIGAGWAMVDNVSDDMVRVSVGLIAISFALYSLMRLWRGVDDRSPAWAQNRHIGRLAGFVSGFTSFFAHAGGPPCKAYLLPQKMDNQVFVGTSVIFFAVVNAVKLIPYAALGQLDMSNLLLSLCLIPLAPIGIWIAVWGVKRMPMRAFYNLTYALIFCVGIKLLYDGVL